jgi:transcription antitermination factor NusG
VYSDKTACAREGEISRQRGSWFALGLRSNFEKTTATLLEHQGYEALSPTYRIRRRWSDRLKEIETPLFPGYVFCRMDLAERGPVLMTPGVVRIIGFGSEPAPVADLEIVAIQAIMKSGLLSRPWPFLAVGDPILVESGPLAGTTGFLTCVDEQYRLIASISLLQRSIAVELDRDWVRPAHSLRSVPAVA